MSFGARIHWERLNSYIQKFTHTHIYTHWENTSGVTVPMDFLQAPWYSCCCCCCSLSNSWLRAYDGGANRQTSYNELHGLYILAASLPKITTTATVSVSIVQTVTFCYFFSSLSLHRYKFDFFCRRLKFFFVCPLSVRERARKEEEEERVCGGSQTQL